MIRHILFPTDGSKFSKQAQEYAKNLALKSRAKVTILHAYEVKDAVMFGRYDVHYNYVDSMNQLLKERGEKLLAQTKSFFEQEGIQTEARLIQGSAGEAIVKTAQEDKCDQIVMGIRGLGAFQEILIGSVSRYVIHHLPCPVLLVP
jgi:nucleotide-binding universal stress UspA family protein